MIKRTIIYIFIFILICLLLPAVISKKEPVKEATIAQDTNIIEKNIYNYNDYSTIKLLHLETNEIEQMYLDEYLYGVVSAEMPASYELEALKAQAIVARTYTIYAIQNASKHENADICDTATCCQAYITKEERFEKWKEEERQSNWNKITEAVNSTSGEIITYEGEPINAFFHANSGGETEMVSNVWGGKDYPYLQTVATFGEEGYSQYSSSIVLTKEEVVEKIKAYYPEIVIDFNLENQIQILEYTDSGRVKIIKFGNIEISGVEARKIFELKSAKFDVIIQDSIIFDVTGYGHGVGMSQTGADSMAKENKTYEEIIKHFYVGVEIQNI